MLDQLIPTAIALICAFSQPLCDQSKTVQFTAVRPNKNTPANLLVLGSYFKSTNTVYVSNYIINPATAALLAHELTHASNGDTDSTPCVQRELKAYTVEIQFLQWFSDSFGLPHYGNGPTQTTLDLVTKNPLDVATAECNA